MMKSSSLHHKMDLLISGAKKRRNLYSKWPMHIIVGSGHLTPLDKPMCLPLETVIRVLKFGQ